MSAVATTQAETRLATLLDERQLITEKWEALTASINAREGEDKALTEVEQEHIVKYRERTAEIDAETETLAGDIEATKTAIENAKKMRRAMAGAEDGVEDDGDGLVYRDFATYARDVIISRDSAECSKIGQIVGSDAVLRARERLQLLKRTPANTLSSDVAGLQPPQYIDQIFQVIDNSRPIVASAQRTSLNRGTLTYPQVTQRPVVAVQASEKTEAGNQAMHVAMETISADTYLGGGDLSWQAINWSTPDALQLWFNLAAADYALQTEEAAAQVIIDAGQAHVLGTTFNAATGTFAQLLTAIGAGAAAVFSNSGRTADTVYMSMDAYWYVFGLTSTAFAQFAQVTDGRVGALNFVPSRGLDSATVVVGDSKALLVAETPGAPVELRVVEPAIGGVEVGIIGAFKSAVVDPGSFALISAAS